MQKQEAGAGNVLIVVPTIDREGTTGVVVGQINGFLEQRLTPFLLVIGPFRRDVFDELKCKLPQQYILLLGQPHTYLSISALWATGKLIKPVLHFIRGNDVRLVIAHAPYAHFLMRLVKMFAIRTKQSCKLVQYFHSLQYEQFPLTKPARSIFNYLNRKLAMKYDNAHLSVSEAVKDDIKKGLFKHKQHKVLLSPLLTNNAAPVLTGNSWPNINADFQILLPGRLEPNKGQLFFLNVLTRLIASEQLLPKNISITLAGAGQQKEEIQRFIDQHGLGMFVHLAGQISHPVLQCMMKQADLVVVPSFHEGLGLVAVEALQAGSLLLASDAGGLKEVVKNGENGFLFKTGNSTDCLQKLRMLYLNRNENLIDQAIVKNDLQERFSFETYMQNLLSFIYKT